MAKSQETISRKRRVLTGLITLVLLAGLIVPSLAEQIAVEYLFDSPQMEKIKIGDVLYDRMNILGAPNSGQPNQPALPAKGAYILLPHNCNVDGISIIQGKKILVGKDYFIEPATTPIRLSACRASMPDQQPLSHYHPVENAQTIARPRKLTLILMSVLLIR